MTLNESLLRNALKRLLDAQQPIETLAPGESRMDASNRWQTERAAAAENARNVLALTQDD